MFEEFMYQQAVRQTKQDMLKVGSRLAEKGLLVGKGGNYSVRIGENQILLTASGFCKSEISEEQISLVDMEGNLLEGLKPAADIRMHLAVSYTHLDVYKRQPSICPPSASAPTSSRRSPTRSGPSSMPTCWDNLPANARRAIL